MYLILYQVDEYDWLGLAINPSNGKHDDLLFWIAEPGEEYYLHHFARWREVPFAFELTATTELTDISLRKVVNKRSDNCESNEEYNYIGKIILQKELL